MYSRLPSLVIGFHGCDAATFNSVVCEGEELHPSLNDYDWLGNGVYFWEQNYDRAFQWAQDQAKRGRIQAPAVIGAVIDLGYCLNLTDSHYLVLLRNEYEIMREEFDLLGIDMPENRGVTEDRLLRVLDCAVVEHLHQRMARRKACGDAEGIEPFDSARGLFSEGGFIYPGAGIKEKTHVQICVRNPNCIKGYFSPRTVNEAWRIP